MSARPCSPRTAKQRYEQRKAEREEERARAKEYGRQQDVEAQDMALLFERLVDAAERIADALERPSPAFLSGRE